MEYVISMNLVAALGWAGAILSLVSYVLVTLGRLKARSVGYQSMVLFAATALAVSSGVNGAWPSAVTNAIYMAIGVVTIGLLLRGRLGRAALALGSALTGAARTLLGSVVTFARRPQGVVPVCGSRPTRVIVPGGRSASPRRRRDGDHLVARSTRTIPVGPGTR